MRGKISSIHKHSQLATFPTPSPALSSSTSRTIYIHYPFCFHRIHSSRLSLPLLSSSSLSPLSFSLLLAPPLSSAFLLSHPLFLLFFPSSKNVLSYTFIDPSFYCMTDPYPWCGRLYKGADTHKRALSLSLSLSLSLFCAHVCVYVRDVGSD